MPILCLDNLLFILNSTIFSPLSIILIPLTIYYFHFIHQGQSLTSQFSSIRNFDDIQLLTKSTISTFQRNLSQSNSNAYPIPTLSEIKLLLWSSSSPYRTLKNLFLYSLIKNSSAAFNRFVRNNGWAADPIDWKKDTVVITGGSTGIGKALVENLSQVHHAKVVVLDMAPPTYRPAPEGAPEILYFKTDVANEEQVMKVAEEVRKVHGDTVGVLVNCAGIAAGSVIMETDP